VTEEKVKLVEDHKDQYGLTTCLDALELPKSTWYYQKKKVAYEEKHKHLKEPLLDGIRAHPGYGYRRILPELRDQGYEVGEFVVRRLLKQWNLGLLRSISKPKLSAPRKYLKQSSKGWNLVKKIADPQPFQVWYTDFTEICYAGGNKKAYLMPILDHNTKWVAGWAVQRHKNTALALESLNIAHENLEEMGLTLEGRFLHQDQDSVYTGYRWLQAVLIRERAKISFSENGARGNTYMESFNARFKGENTSLFVDARNMWELRRAIALQIEYYNAHRRHSTLGYLAPQTYINQQVTLPEPALDLAPLSS
jgi:putative transposase